MARVSERNLSPRNGHTLMAGLGARISGCSNQKEESLEDQTDHNKEVVAELFDRPVEYLIVATKGKGEHLDRPELVQIEAEFRKGKLDVFVWEDLGRLVRGAEAVRLLGIAVDHGCPCDRAGRLPKAASAQECQVPVRAARRLTKTRRRDGFVWVRLAAVPKDDLPVQWIGLTPEVYRADRTCVYQPVVVHGTLSGGRR